LVTTSVGPIFITYVFSSPSSFFPFLPFLAFLAFLAPFLPFFPAASSSSAAFLRASSSGLSGDSVLNFS